MATKAGNYPLQMIVSLALWQRSGIFATHSLKSPSSPTPTCFRATRARCFLTSAVPQVDNEELDGRAFDFFKLPRLFVGPLPTSAQILGENVDWHGKFCGPSDTGQPEMTAGSVLQLSMDQTHYLTTVLRLGKKHNDDNLFVRVMDGVHGEWLARVEMPKNAGRKLRDALSVTCIKQLRSPEGQRLKPILVIAPPKKRERFRWLLEKTTELGVGGFILIETENIEPFHEKIEKIASYVIEATEQCERLDLPHFWRIGLGSSGDDGAKTSLTSPLSSVLRAVQSQSNIQVIIARERSPTSTPLCEALTICIDSFPRTWPLVFVGPEGGWSASEQSKLDKLQEKGHLINISLGRNVLRTETAAMTAVAAWSLCETGRP